MLVKSQTELLGLLPQIVELADSEKTALSFWPENQLREAIARERLWAFVDGQRLQGCLVYSGVFPHAKVQLVAVAPSVRKQGVATTLLRSLISELERLGFMSIKAEIASDLQAALAFYKSLGFEESHRRSGGKSRNRKIIVHVLEFDTDTLFSVPNGRNVDFDLGLKRRSASEAPFYAIDLNVYLDLVKDREHSENAGRIFWAALDHQIRLAVATEFVAELLRNTTNHRRDPVLKLAMRLPKIPSTDPLELEALSMRILGLVFPRRQSASEITPQSKSDARHLAHAALARASAFVTRDGALLAARHRLVTTIGIDVIDLKELIDLLPPENVKPMKRDSIGEGFVLSDISVSQLKEYLTKSHVPDLFVEEFCADEDDRTNAFRIAFLHKDRIVAAGTLLANRTAEAIWRMLVHGRPDNPDIELFLDHLLDRLLRKSCTNVPAAIEMVHIPGQSTAHSLAKARGFVRSSTSRDFTKVAFGRPLTPENWSNSVHSIRRRTGLTFPSELPFQTSQTVAVRNSSGSEFSVKPSELGDLLSPTIVIWQGRDAALVPIRRSYADELLGTSKQGRFDFIANKDASFFSRRCYVNSPRFASIMRPGNPVVFYESKKEKFGRRAAIAIARIVDAVIVGKADIRNDRLRRLVVEDVEGFSATDEVLLTSFDNLFEITHPVPLGRLREINAVDGANLQSPVMITCDQVINILSWGWPDE